MKKYIFLLMPLALAFGGCKHKTPTPSPSPTPTQGETSSSVVTPTKEEVVAFKALLDEQDLSPFYQKCFASQFTHEFSILDIENGEIGKTTNFFNYTGIGWLDFYYDISEGNYDSLMDDYGVINIFDAMSKGEGGYRIMQSSDATSYLKEPAEESISQKLSIAQSMTLKTTESDVLVSNSLLTTDTDAFEYEKRQEFNGKIDKDLLFSTVSTKSFRDIFSTVNLFGAPEDIEYLDSLYYLTCQNLKDKSDEEISEFIVDKKIEMSEGEEYLDVKFSFDGEELEDNDSIPGIINGTFHFDKETHSFEEFEYVIEFVSESVNEETGDILFANMKFTCAGISSREQLGTIITEDDPTVYDDVQTFLEDVRKNVVPPTIY